MQDKRTNVLIFFSLKLFFLCRNVTEVKQSGPYKTILNRKFPAALQQVELPSALAQVGALLRISSLNCWIIALLETNLLFSVFFCEL